VAIDGDGNAIVTGNPLYSLTATAGLAAELEPEELKEVLLQLAVYAGVPAANTAHQIAAEELR